MNQEQQKLKLNASNGGIAFAVMMIVYVFISFIGQAICKQVFGEGTLGYVATCSTFSVISLLGVVLYFVFYGKNKFKSTVGLENAGGLYSIIALLLCVGMFAGIGFINGAIAEILAEFNLKVGGINLEISSPTHFIVYTITFAILPAVVEEFFFRGLLLNSLSGVKAFSAVIISAVCFAFYHCSLSQFIYQFIYGVMLGCLVLLAKSVVPCIVAHFVNNFAIILFTYLGVNIDLLDPIVLLIGINALAIFCTIIYFGFKKEKKAIVEKGEGKNFFLPYGVFGLLVCFVLLLGSVLG